MVNQNINKMCGKYLENNDLIIGIFGIDSENI